MPVTPQQANELLKLIEQKNNQKKWFPVSYAGSFNQVIEADEPFFEEVRKIGISQSAMIESGLMMVIRDEFAHDHEEYGEENCQILYNDDDGSPEPVECENNEVAIRLQGGELLETSKSLMAVGAASNRLFFDFDRLQEIASQSRQGGRMV